MEKTGKKHTNRRKECDLTQCEVKESLYYDSETGIFTWVSERRGLCIGDKAGSLNDQGYVVIRVNKVLVRAHRLAFLYMEGEFPENQVDHINGVRDDNRWCNLRKVTVQENRLNMGKPTNNTSGQVGVMWYKAGNKWHSQIAIGKNKIHLGYYDSFEEAIAARKAAEVAYNFSDEHGERDSYVRKKLLESA